MTIDSIQWKALATAAVGILLSVIAFSVNQATEQLRALNVKMATISETLAVAVQRLDEQERRLSNLERLYMVER